MPEDPGSVRFLRRAEDRIKASDRRHGVSLLPSLFTMANLFCGYACVVYALNGEYKTAALLIGIAFLFDMLDGRIARYTGTASDFGVQFDSLADVISFGVAPAILSFAWGLKSLGRLGWAACFIFVAAAALRLARFNIQTGSGDKRYFVGMPSPSAASIPASTVYFYPGGLDDFRAALPALLMVVVPALLMVSTIRYRSFKTIDLRARRPYRVLLLVAVLIILVATLHEILLLAAAYAYLASGFIELIVTRTRHRGGQGETPEAISDAPLRDTAAR
jgi:CDP-diacylglycerol---serine O-phosphatidyltransferase